MKIEDLVSEESIYNYAKRCAFKTQNQRKEIVKELFDEILKNIEIAEMEERD